VPNSKTVTYATSVKMSDTAVVSSNPVVLILVGLVGSGKVGMISFVP
jgi:hypothetical protein